MAIIGLKSKRDTTVKTDEAQALEEWEKQRLLNRNTERAINQTYGPKSRTKARRKLPGKRKWKNKEEQYKVLRGQMVAKEYNLKSGAMKTLDKIYKRQHIARQKHRLAD